MANDNAIPEDGDLIDRLTEDYLEKRESDTTEQTPIVLDEKQAREEAMRLYQLEEDLNELMLKFPKGKTTSISPGLGVHGLSKDGGATLYDLNRHFKGLGEGGIILSIFSDGDILNAREYGVSTRFQLNVKVHTDEASMNLAESLQSDPVVLMTFETRYYFDKNGNYAKVIHLPGNLEELSREESNPWVTRLVKREMTAGDFELAGVALGKLKTSLTPHVPNA